MNQDLDSIYDEYLHLRELITKQLEGIPADSEQAKFLRSELDVNSQKLAGLQDLHSIYLQRYIISILSWLSKCCIKKNKKK